MVATRQPLQWKRVDPSKSYVKWSFVLFHREGQSRFSYGRDIPMNHDRGHGRPVRLVLARQNCSSACCSARHAAPGPPGVIPYLSSHCCDGA